MNYHDYLKTEQWREVSRRVKERAGFKCQICNSPRDLVAHHRTYAHVGREMEHLDDLICLCDRCHQTFHAPKEINGVMRPTRMPDRPEIKPVSEQSKKQAKINRRLLRMHARAAKRAARAALKAKNQQPLPRPVESVKINEPFGPYISEKKRQKIERRLVHPQRMAEASNAVSSLYNHEADMPLVFPLVIDSAFLEKVRTKAGGHTSKTLTALGVQIPPRPGWPRELIGKPLTKEQCWAALVGRECKSTVKTLARRTLVQQPVPA